MITPLPTIEPSIITSGDTWAWRKVLPNYPATDGWVLNYALINASGKILFSAGADGGDHLVSVAATTTASYFPGQYSWQSYITKSSTGERYTLAVGVLDVVESFAAQAAGADVRSEAKRILDTLTAGWLAATETRAFVAEYQIGTRRMKFSTRQEWIVELDYWRRIVAREEQAEKLKRGIPTRRKVMVRF